MWPPGCHTPKVAPQPHPQFTVVPLPAAAGAARAALCWGMRWHPVNVGNKGQGDCRLRGARRADRLHAAAEQPRPSQSAQSAHSSSSKTSYSRRPCWDASASTSSKNAHLREHAVTRAQGTCHRKRAQALTGLASRRAPAPGQSRPPASLVPAPAAWPHAPGVAPATTANFRATFKPAADGEGSPASRRRPGRRSAASPQTARASPP